VAVTNNEAEQRYELEAEGATAIAAYKLEGDTIVFTHTEVPEELEGQGIGSRLVSGALEDVRRRGLKARPLCSFVAGYMERHPETRDLIA
jgi:uncharacterized protein